MTAGARAARRWDPPSLLLLYPAGFFCPLTGWLLVHGVLSWADAFFLASALTFLVSQLVRGRPIPISASMVATALLLMTISLFSWIQLGNPATVRECLKLVIATTIVPMVIAWALAQSDLSGTRRLLLAWVLGATLSASVAAASRFGYSLFGLTDLGGGGRAGGLTYHPNSFAYCSAIAIPPTLFLIFTAKARLERVAYIALLLLFAYSIQHSGSRIGVAAGLASLGPFALHFWTHANERRARVALVVGATLVVGTTALVILDAFPLGHQFSALSRLIGKGITAAESDFVREQISRRVISDIVASPIIGSGFQLIRVAHNYPLQVIHAGGVLAALAFLIWGTGLAGLYLGLRRPHYVLEPDPDARLLWVLIPSLFLCWAVVGLFQTLITDRNGYLWIALLLSFAMRAQVAASHARPAAAGRPARLATRAAART